MLQCAPAAQDDVTATLEQEGLVRVDTRFETGGATVLMNALALPRNGARGFARPVQVAS
jgi:hypothetical protein